MRRCYRNVALVLSGVLLASNTFSNSHSGNIANVYAAEDTLSETRRNCDSVTIAAIMDHAPVPIPALSAFQGNIQTGEENVETEIPTDESDSMTVSAEIEEELCFNLNDNDYHVLLKIVEAEAGSEDLAGKMLVANVVMNRVQSDIFPDTVTEVVYQKHRGTAQFSPTADGRIHTVTVSPETTEAVRRVLHGEDLSCGALFFRSSYCSSSWFDNTLTKVLEHGNHIFYTIRQ